jgi:uncharacterized protein YbjT (DUF2867 family)
VLADTNCLNSELYSTGISGYLGGHVTTSLLEKHPDYVVKALVRDNNQAEAIKAKLPLLLL